MFARGCGLVAIFALGAGCSKDADKLPDLIAVRGAITQNGRPVTKGFVRFMPEGDQQLIVSGDVDANGAFELYTVKNNNRKKGAPPGTYRVTYQAPSQDQKTAQLTAPKSYTIDAASNELKIELLEKK